MMVSPNGTGKDLRDQRSAAAHKYKPQRVRILLVAEAPPSAPDRYFYFENVQTQDSLFRYVVRGVLGIEPTRAEKPALLRQLQEAGVFLVDLSPDPVGGTPLNCLVDDLTKRINALSPDSIILIKATVYDAAYSRLRGAGLPVIDERIPFPGSGQQKRFERAFQRALEAAG